MPSQTFAQCDIVAEDCSVDLFPFISDGQFYRVDLSKGEDADLKLTFLGGSSYRLVVCGEQTTESDIEFSLYSSENEKIFTNQGMPDIYSWDFKTKFTDNYRLNIKLNSGYGCVIILVGYD